MNCALCKKEISGYNLAFNHLKIDPANSVDICSSCVDAFLKWQQGVFAKLYPTSLMKKRFGKERRYDQGRT